MEPLTLTSSVMSRIAEKLFRANLGPAVENKVASTAPSARAYNFEDSRSAAQSLHGTGRMARATEHAGAVHYSNSRNLSVEANRETNRGQMMKMSA